MTFDLFDALDPAEPTVEPIAEGAVVLRALARAAQDDLLADANAVIAAAPLRHLITPGGLRMSVGMTNCGALGWVSDRRGYRYDAIDPERGVAVAARIVPAARRAGGGERRLRGLRARRMPDQPL